ncbi:MAG: GAF domain-containing protein [Anaerolineae bacterium]|nr:GAF domain-containing protein [Anaerolineae bacterium]
MIRVLILDDDPLFARPLARRLASDSDDEIQAVVAHAVDEAVQAVQCDPQSFDAFLIDERLGAGKDGIRAMEDLLRIRPDAEAIIFTGFDDPSVGYRALQAGAWGYLPKSENLAPELIWRLRSLRGLRLLEEAMHRAQRAASLKEVADIITQGGLWLGFERARLWRVDAGAQTLEGLSCAGACGPADMPERRIPIAEACYVRRAFESPHEITRFCGEELGPGYLARSAAHNGYRPPVGEWLAAPLCDDDGPIGLLVLDNVAQPREITADQHRLLRQFRPAAAGALERARFYEHQRQLNEAGRRIMTQAARSNLDKLLKAVRSELGGFTNAHNFIAALVEEEGSQRYLHYRVRYEDDRLQPPSWRPLSEPGLLAHVIARNEPLFLPDGVEEYRAEHGLRAFGKPARSWMGAPLRVKGKVFGVIAVENNHRAKAYTRGEFEQFVALVEHVQGALQVARLEEEQEQNVRRLCLLQRASEEMMRLADERGEEALWLAALTAATANYGLQFNRAALFLAKDGGARLIGRAGVGHFDRAEAREAWAADRRANMTFDRFLSDLRRSALKPTPVHRAVCNWEIDLSSKGWDVFQSVLRAGRPDRVPAARAALRLPGPFVERFGVHDYAVVPLRAGSRVIGLAVVDNAHDGKPIRRLALDYLESLLAHAALTYEDYRQRKAHERLNRLTCEVLSHAGRQSLKDTLTEICEVALEVSGVDCASIVPASEAGLKFTYELEHAGSAGWQKAAEPVRMPRPDGVTEHALRTGEPVVVEDVNKHDVRYAGKLITEHPTLREEGVRALICAPIRAVETGEALGAFRLYWRSPQTFASADLTQAEMFARLAAVAIQHWRAAQRMRAAAEAEVASRERELTIHRRVMHEALMPGATQERVVRALLDAAHDALNLPQIAVELDLRVWERSDDSADSKPRQVRHAYYRNANGLFVPEMEPDLFRGVIGRAFQSGRTQLVPDVTLPEWRGIFYPFVDRETRSELVVPIVHDRSEVIGAFNVESPLPGAFGPAHASALERLAGVAALALDNARRLEGRRRVLETSKDIAAPIELDRTLETIPKVVRDIAPDASAFTIWHMDLETGQMKLGAHFGVRDRDALLAERASDGGVIRRVLHRKRPLFVNRAEGHPFSSDFVAREGIRSYAALPLRAEGQEVGVMFLAYRHPHRFTLEERLLFEVLANLAAGSIRDAALLEFARRQRDQRDLAQRAAEVAATAYGRDEALRRIMNLLQEHYARLHAAIAIYIYEPAEHRLKVDPASLDFYPFEDVSETGVLKVDDGSIAGHVARMALESRDFEFYNCPDAGSDRYFLQGTEGMRSELCASLMSVSRDLLGVLILESPNRDAFDEDDEEQIRGIARQISLVMERAELGDQLLYQTSLAVATGGFVDFAHVARSELLKIRRRAAWLSRKESALSEQGRCWLGEVKESAARLRQVFNEAQTGESDAATEPLPCDALVRALVEEACEQRPTARLELEWDLQCGDARVEVNREALRWVLGHLVGNAVEAMGGAGRLTVRTQRRAGQWAEVRIEDDGPGVDPEVRLFLFRQAIPGRPRRGTGLLRVRQRVESMGGTVRLLDAEPGRGAIFAITLRVAQA